MNVLKKQNVQLFGYNLVVISQWKQIISSYLQQHVVHPCKKAATLPKDVKPFL